MSRTWQLGIYVPATRGRLAPRGAVAIASEPPGAAVFLFRYEERAGLLQPDAMPPARLVVVGPLASELESAGVRIGDRIVSVQGRNVGICGNRHLAAFSTEYEPGPIAFEQGGERRVILFDNQLRDPVRGVSSRRATSTWLSIAAEGDALPLAFLATGSCGITPLAAQTLEAGSYLAVLRRGGCRDTRVPFVVERDARLELRERILRDSDIPAGMVHVPAGPARLGGDPFAFYAEPRRLVHMENYFIGRYEVSVGEYMEFLRDPKGGSGFDDLEPLFHAGGHTRERRTTPSYRLGLRLVAQPTDSGP